VPVLIVLSHFTYVDDALERAQAPDVEFFTQPASSAAASPVPSSVRQRADAIIHYASNTVPDGSVADWPSCRALVRSGVGFDRIDLAAWGARGVPVFNVPDYGTSEVADHALALMLALTRGTATYHDALRRDRWPQLFARMQLEGYSAVECNSSVWRIDPAAFKALLCQHSLGFIAQIHTTGSAASEPPPEDM
jgi:lactate dehydrogenase-like 2-hydroxyacid dehydrogenase